MSTELAMRYGYSTQPSTLMNSIFMFTVNTAARTLLAVASSAKPENSERWKLMDHMKYIVMLMTWMAVWVLRVLLDHFPCSIGSSNPYVLEDFSSVGSSDLAPLSSSSTLYASSVFSMDLVPGSNGLPVQALGRALSHILVLLNDLPATSRKYQFAVAMADKIVDENAREGHVELLQLNCMALASAFARTSSLLYCSIRSSQTVDNYSSTWTTHIFSSIPLSSLLGNYLVKGLSAIFPFLNGGMCGLQKQRHMTLIGGEGACEDHVMAEKHAQELLWLTNKMGFCGAVDEALLQWSLATSLASVSLTANPRVQGFMVKISVILIRASIEAPRDVRFRLLGLWLPLFCYADNGVAYPTLTGYEKAEMERILDELISSLPVAEQQFILANWLQDFTFSTSDWPNLRLSYDRWCQKTRKLIA